MRKKRTGTLTALRGRQWHGRDAEDYLYERLQGCDGEEAWTLEKAGEEVAKKIGSKKPINVSSISHWHSRQRLLREQERNLKITNEALLRFATDGGKEVDLEDLADALLTNMLAEIYRREDVEQAIDVTKALTSLTKALTEKNKLAQRAKEHEESIAKLKARLAKAHEALKKHGLTQEQVNELNEATVSAIDEEILSRSQ